jgi:hypothetical protein
MKKLFLFISIILISIAGFGQRFTIEESPTVGFFQMNDVDYKQGHYGVRYAGNIAVDSLRVFSLYNIYENKDLISSRYFDEVAGVTSWDELSQLFTDIGVLSSNDVNIQDQHTPLIIAYFSKEVGADTLVEAAEIGDMFITVDDTTGLRVGGYLSIFSVPDNRFYLANILTRVVDTLGVDTPLDFAFPIGSFVTSGEKNMNVDGSVTPVIYGLRNTEQAIGSAFDITRIIITCMTDAPVDLSKFGDIAGGLTRGLVMRKKDGIYRNVFNVKTNGDLASIMYDWTPYLATNPVQGQDGFVGRLTFAGQSKMGVTLRIEPGEDIQVLVQDNQTSINEIFIIAEGHTVE